MINPLRLLYHQFTLPVYALYGVRVGSLERKKISFLDFNDVHSAIENADALWKTGQWDRISIDVEGNISACPYTVYPGSDSNAVVYQRSRHVQHPLEVWRYPLRRVR